MILKSITTSILLLAVLLFGTVGCSSIARKLLFHPTHRPHNNSLTPWISNGETIGYAREIASPKNIWLMLHGNAGQAADRLLRETYPDLRVCVVAESIGSGPASYLATLSQPPDKLILIVPFDKISLVAQNYFPSFLVDRMLKDNWDNIEALLHYQGPIEIFGAEADTIIPVRHAKALAAAIPKAKMTLIGGSHNDWSHHGRVTIRNP